ncbi:MAG TPA: ATP synthase F0 subunit B [Terriglobia bacterium]|nr:ATP synthase F0 subunit B [Terriglobia bacterium]
MGEIASQLGQLLVQSIPTIIFVLFLVAFLNRLFFKPLSRTLDARSKATSGALAEAREQAERAEARFADYEKAILEARQKIYQHREEVRRESLDQRDSRIHDARARADSMVNEAQAGLEKEVVLAKAELQAAVDSLAVEVTDTLFAPRLSRSGQGGVPA